MNKETREFLEDGDFATLYEVLYETHKPDKARLKPENLQSIGKIIVCFERLESTIRHFIGILANIPGGQKIDDIFTAKSSFENLVLILRALAVERNFYRSDDLSKALQMTKKAEEIRNQVVHSVWTSGPRFKEKLDHKNGLVYQTEMYEEGELERIAVQISKIDTSIEALSFDYIAWCKKHGIALNGSVHVSSQK